MQKPFFLGCTVYDIVIHPSFLKKVQENSFFQNFFLTVVFQGLEDKYGLELDRNWTILKNKKSMGKVQSHFIRTKSKPVIMDVENTSMNASQQVKKGTVLYGRNMFIMLIELSGDAIWAEMTVISAPKLQDTKFYYLSITSILKYQYIQIPNSYI